jgi:hypothetical protein
MDPEVIDQVRAANEACMTLLTLMAMDDTHEEAARLIAEDPAYTERTTCMALAGFAISATNALARELDIPLEIIIQSAAQNAALHTMKLEQELEGNDEEE